MLEFRRGDSFFFKFFRKDFNKEKITTKAEKMWCTIKDNTNSKKNLIQKTLGNGITYTSDDSFYHVAILPIDSKKLKYKKYVIDIQVENAGVVNTIYLDKIKIKEEVTFEGGEE